MTRFSILLFGQLLAQIGAGMTAFALSVLTFQQSKSVVDFSMILFFTELPGILLSPLAGIIVDRWNRKMVLIISDALAAIATLALIPLAMQGPLPLPVVLAYVTAVGLFRSVQWPAFSATLTWLVKKDDIGRASGLMQMSEALSIFVSPLLCVFVLSIASLSQVLMIDVAAFSIAAVFLFVVPLIKPKAGTEDIAPKHFWADIGSGWHFIRDRVGLRNLLRHMALLNFSGGITLALSLPLIMTLATQKEVGVINSLCALGMMAGGLVAGMFNTPGQRVYAIVGATAISGIAAFVTGSAISIYFVGAGLILSMFVIGVISAMSQAIWQLKVPSEIQGRVFAFRRMVAMSTMPLAYLVAGPLVEFVGKPVAAMSGGQSNFSISFVYFLVGLWIFMVGAISLLSPKYRHLETELPDAVHH